ncbi:MAG: PASTA domain-containing protein [bacterium]|nr:PASTA domain-containing protein [bacterium]
MGVLKAVLREVTLFVACAIFTGTVGLIVVDTIVMPRLVRKGQQVEVPNVVELRSDQARVRLRRRGLHMKTRDPRWDTSVPEGHILSQSPAAASKVKPNRTVYVVPSKGSRLYTVPDVRKRMLRQARLWIEQSGLVLDAVTGEPSRTVKEGEILRQDPGPNTKVDVGAKVSVVISTGPPRAVVAMPNLVEMNLAKARRLLQDMGLRSENIRYKFSTAYEPNIVIGQSPQPGEAVKLQTNVRLMVSKL